MNESVGFLPLPTRRRVLKTLAGAGGLLATDQFGRLSASALASSTDHRHLLDLAATTGALGLSFYHTALSCHSALGGVRFQVTDSASRQLRSMLAAQQRDAKQVRALGGQLLTRSVALPEALTSDANTFVHTGLHLEQASSHFYLSATRDLAAQNKSAQSRSAQDRSEAAMLMARLAAHAAQRQVQLAHLAGLGSEEGTLAGRVRSTSEALAILAVYLGRPQAGFFQVELSSAAELDRAL